MSSRQTQRRTSKMYTLEATATSAQSSPVPSISENQSAPDRPTRRVLFKRSSASSKLSITPSIFDKDDSTNSPELSPITPPEDPSEPLGNTPESNHGIFAESPDLKLSVAKQRRSRKKTRTYIAGPSRAQDAISQHTPSRSSRHHSWRNRTSMGSVPKPNIQGSNHLDVPESIEPRQRATSAPSLPTNRKSRQEDDRQDEDSEHCDIPCTWVSSQETFSENDAQHSTEASGGFIDIAQSSFRGVEATDASGSNFGEEGRILRHFYPFDDKEHDEAAINLKVYDVIAGKIRKEPPSPEKKPHKDPASQKDIGWVYVFTAPDDEPNYVKIGRTKKGAHKRKDALENCGFNLHKAHCKVENAFLHYEIVELLIHKALHNERKKFDCHCSTVHGEFFEMNEERALEHVDMWCSWVIDKKPFDEDGYLTDYWKWRVKKLKADLNNVKWRSWTQPTIIDWFDFLLEQYGEGCYLQLKDHIGRKDSTFCQRGLIITLILYIYFGWSGAAWAITGLTIL